MADRIVELLIVWQITMEDASRWRIEDHWSKWNLWWRLQIVEICNVAGLHIVGNLLADRCWRRITARDPDGNFRLEGDRSINIVCFGRSQDLVDCRQRLKLWLIAVQIGDLWIHRGGGGSGNAANLGNASDQSSRRCLLAMMLLEKIITTLEGSNLKKKKKIPCRYEGRSTFAEAYV